MTSIDTRLAYAHDFHALRGLDRLASNLTILSTCMIGIADQHLTPSTHWGRRAACVAAIVTAAVALALIIRSRQWYRRRYGEMTPRRSTHVRWTLTLFALTFAAAGAVSLIRPAMAVNPVNLWALALIPPTILAQRSGMRHVGRTVWHWAGNIAMVLVALWPAVGGPSGFWAALVAFAIIHSVTAVVDHHRLLRNLPPVMGDDV